MIITTTTTTIIKDPQKLNLELEKRGKAGSCSKPSPVDSLPSRGSRLLLTKDIRPIPAVPQDIHGDFASANTNSLSSPLSSYSSYMLEEYLNVLVFVSLWERHWKLSRLVLSAYKNVL